MSRRKNIAVYVSGLRSRIPGVPILNRNSNVRKPEILVIIVLELGYTAHMGVFLEIRTNSQRCCCWSSTSRHTVDSETATISMSLQKRTIARITIYCLVLVVIPGWPASYNLFLIRVNDYLTSYLVLVMVDLYVCRLSVPLPSRKDP